MPPDSFSLKALVCAKAKRQKKACEKWKEGPCGSAAVPGGCHATAHTWPSVTFGGVEVIVTLSCRSHHSVAVLTHRLPRNYYERHATFKGARKHFLARLLFIYLFTYLLLGEVVAVVVVVVVLVVATVVIVFTVSVMLNNISQGCQTYGTWARSGPQTGLLWHAI